MPRTPSPVVIDHDSRDLLDEFLAQVDVADLTLLKYRTQLSEYARWLAHPSASVPGEDPRSLRTASARDIQRFLGYLRGGNRFVASPTVQGSTGPLSAGSRKNYLASIRSLYRYLVLAGVLTRDPTVGIRSPKQSTRPGFTLTTEELERLLRIDGSPRERITTFLLVFTAARVNEIRELTWDDIDLRERTLTIHGKGGTHHTIDIHPRLMVELRRWYLHQTTMGERDPAIAEALERHDTAYVLLTRNGRQLAPGAIAKQLKRRATRAGLHVLEAAHGEHRSRVSPHAIRRSIATALLNDGEPIDAVADVLNHRHLDTTRRHYAFSSTPRRRATIKAILR